MNNSFYVSIDTEALKHNISYLKNYRKKDILPVVKANAYGHDKFIITKALYDMNIKTWAVARISEAVDIINFMANNGIKDFEVLSFEDCDDYDFLKNNKNLIISINNFKSLKEALSNNIDTERLALKIDLGFGRNGISVQECDELKNFIKYNNLKFHSVFSHLFSATYEDGKNFNKIFSDIVSTLGVDNFKMIHLQNAAGIYNYDCEIVTHIRTGMLIYGLQEPGFYDFNLRPVCNEVAGKIDTVKYVDDLNYLAYDKLSILNSETKKIAKIKIGYGDGFPKSNKGTFCLIKNKEYKIASVTMDNTFIEVDDRVEVGDKVILYHRPNELKAKIGLGILELLISLIPERVARKIKGNNL